MWLLIIAGLLFYFVSKYNYSLKILIAQSSAGDRILCGFLLLFLIFNFPIKFNREKLNNPDVQKAALLQPPEAVSNPVGPFSAGRWQNIEMLARMEPALCNLDQPFQFVNGGKALHCTQNNCIGSETDRDYKPAFDEGAFTRVIKFFRLKYYTMSNGDIKQEFDSIQNQEEFDKKFENDVAYKNVFLSNIKKIIIFRRCE